jgi:hypothetical protein
MRPAKALQFHDFRGFAPTPLPASGVANAKFFHGIRLYARLGGPLIVSAGWYADRIEILAMHVFYLPADSQFTLRILPSGLNVRPLSLDLESKTRV